ncbi:ImmA/IrrE family metallo-endopeptidase [Sphingomonas sp. YR710]|uniref:ImmA/IrrE family metallo-endopeptidase n=1 Tax=Sphingomonas sp. YR710 TaxID=1882773 RepID=UPI003525BFD1
MSDVEKTEGIILCAAGLAEQRRRFASAHALGHFLIKTHRGDRKCTNRDLGEKRTDTPQRKEEMQANRFAAGLLMPKPWFVEFVAGLGKPTVTHLPIFPSSPPPMVSALRPPQADMSNSRRACMRLCSSKTASCAICDCPDHFPPPRSGREMQLRRQYCPPVPRIPSPGLRRTSAIGY